MVSTSRLPGPIAAAIGRRRVVAPLSRRKLRALFSTAVVIVLAAVPFPARAEVLSSYAFVRDDATLRLKGETIRLHGVLIPDQGRQCRRFVRPARCGLNRAAEALDFLIQGFVRCEIAGTYEDGSLAGRCFTGYSLSSDGIDLGAYLIEEGLAVATEDAPFGYVALERIARAQGRGIWGFAVDGIGNRR